MFNRWIDKKIDKKDNINRSIFFKTETFEANVKVELDLSNYAIKADFKKCASGLSCLKSKAGKLDIGKLEITPVDLNKLRSI